MSKPQENPLQQPQLQQSIDALLRLIEDEERFTRRENIFIGGFGQGFAVAAGALLVDGEGDLGGLIGFNG